MGPELTLTYFSDANIEMGSDHGVSPDVDLHERVMDWLQNNPGGRVEVTLDQDEE